MNLKDLNLDAFYVSDHLDKKYYSGFTGSTSEVILSNDKNIFITDGRYKTQSKNEVKDFDIVFTNTSGSGSYFDTIVKVISDNNFKKVGFQNDKLTVLFLQKLQEALPNVEFVGVENAVTSERIIKNKDEVEKTKDAIKITDEMFTKISGALKEGMTEKELALFVDNQHLILGGDAPSFETIAAFGENTAKPHANPSDKKLQVGDIVTIDCGVFLNGYCSDMTRTFFFKENNNEKLKEIWEIVKETNRLQTEALKPGVTCQEIDAIGRNYMKKFDMDQYFVHGTGHGIGLDIHEAPTLNPVSNETLEAGMIVTIEPGIYIEGLGGVRIENDILITEDGYENLTHTPIEYILG